MEPAAQIGAFSEIAERWTLENDGACL
jgi:hypothetical protein